MTSAGKSRPWWLLCVILLCSCDGDPSAKRLSGGVFGTTWSLTYLVDSDTPSSDAVETALLAAFNVVNQQMNNYDPASTISQFNRLPPGEPIEVGWDFAYVLTEALRIGEASQGAYDVTVSPVAALWGFGPAGPTQVPDEAALSDVLRSVGVEHLEWEPETRRLAKRAAGTALDLSSIAKGYGVDLGADALDELGVTRYMLEVGGEVRLRGLSPRDDLWRIAIEKPVTEGAREVQAAIVATDVGIATSGDYRNFFEVDGVRYSHLIDPRTGQPIRHDLVSVTVVHPSTAVADAWATALTVMGFDAGLAAATQQRLAVYFVRRQGDQLSVHWTSPMAAFLNEGHQNPEDRSAL